MATNLNDEGLIATVCQNFRELLPPFSGEVPESWPYRDWKGSRILRVHELCHIGIAVITECRDNVRENIMGFDRH
jgi:hypothetical protein